RRNDRIGLGKLGTEAGFIEQKPLDGAEFLAAPGMTRTRGHIQALLKSFTTALHITSRNLPSPKNNPRGHVFIRRFSFSLDHGLRNRAPQQKVWYPRTVFFGMLSVGVVPRPWSVFAWQVLISTPQPGSAAWLPQSPLPALCVVVCSWF
ncbi:MAG TPA: hypothetical protein VKB66_08970, partial [Candidatus Acidoferrum sp.]|nr:hypothetical protein [Candidatus Acidoferrum sp.]